MPSEKTKQKKKKKERKQKQSKHYLFDFGQLISTSANFDFGQFPELSGDGGRARLVVLAAEVGGRWSIETANFLVSLAKAKALASPLVLQGKVQQAYIRRWSALLACSAVRAFTASLLDRRPVPGLGDIPSVHEVVREARFV